MILRLTILWATAAGTLLLHALMGIPGDYLGQGYPLTPGLPVTVPDLTLTGLGATLPIPLFTALARRFPLRWIALPPIVLLWLCAAAILIEPFASDFGTTWAWTEPLRALFLNPVHMPLALAFVAAVALWSLAAKKSG